MRRLSLIALAIALSVCAAISHAAAPANPFGVMLGGSGIKQSQRFAVARELGVAYFRPWDVTIEGWKGAHADADAALNAGFRLILTVRNSGSSGSPVTPSTPPNDLTKYQRVLDEILQRYQPDVLVIEHEETSERFYTGTPSDYAKQLQAACEVAHRHGVRCANGGMASGLVAAMAQGNDPDALKQGRAFLDAYKAAGVDYVNFHWYVPDAAALHKAVALLRAETGLPVMTNEIGQLDTSPETVVELLEAALELELPYVVWYSVDRRAKALQYQDGTLRANGRAFKQFLGEHLASGDRAR